MVDTHGGMLDLERRDSMPWEDRSVMSQRLEFVLAASQPGANITALCTQHGISRTTAYTWLHRFQDAGAVGLRDQSRRPHHSPRKTAPEVEARVVALRQQHPAWGGTKLRSRLVALGCANVPSASTITAILARHGLLTRRVVPAKRRGNGLRPPHPMTCGSWTSVDRCRWKPRDGCTPWRLIDDHSRFAVALVACPNQQRTTVQHALESAFRPVRAATPDPG